MVNDLGIDPMGWFKFEKKDPPPPFDWEETAPSEYEPPDDNRWAPPERRAELDAELESNPRPEEEVAEWFNDKKEDDQMKKEETIHDKMYEIATSRYNPFSVGGSENCDSDLDCNIGGSEKINGTD
jgi:hypothetical protein